MSNAETTVSNSSLIGRAAQTADHAIQSTQAAANQALDGLSSSVQGLKSNAESLSQRSQEILRQSAKQLREKAVRVNDHTRQYIVAEPMKAMLLAAGAGAAVMALLTLVARSRRAD